MNYHVCISSPYSLRAVHDETSEILRDLFWVKYLVESWPPAWATVTRHDKGGSNAIDHDEGTENLAIGACVTYFRICADLVGKLRGL